MSESILFTKTTREHLPPRLDVEMSVDQFNVLQQDSLTYDQLTLTQLAEQQPAAAYDRFRRIIGHIILTAQANSFSHQSYEQELFDGEVASITEKEHDIVRPHESSDDQVDAARDYMLQFLPDSPDANFDLAVSVRLNDDEADLFGTISVDMLDFSFRKSRSSDQV